MYEDQAFAGDNRSAPALDQDTSRGALIERFAETASDFGTPDAESLAGLAL